MISSFGGIELSLFKPLKIGIEWEF